MEVAGPLGTPLGLAQRKRASPRGELSHPPDDAGGEAREKGTSGSGLRVAGWERTQRLRGLPQVQSGRVEKAPLPGSGASQLLAFSPGKEQAAAQVSEGPKGTPPHSSLVPLSQH